MRKTLLIVVAAVMSVGATALPASAAGSGDTTATFTLAGGSLDVTAATAATLTGGATGAATVGGSLGPVDVSDTRGSTAGWVVSAGSTTFVDGAGSSSTGVSYDSGVAVATGTVTAGTLGSTVITTAAPVLEGTAASGNNTASFTPTLTVALPASALAGTYTGTVTTSVV